MADVHGTPGLHVKPRLEQWGSVRHAELNPSAHPHANTGPAAQYRWQMLPSTLVGQVQEAWHNHTHTNTHESCDMTTHQPAGLSEISDTVLTADHRLQPGIATLFFLYLWYVTVQM